jgi:hypothetical protein
VGTGVSVFTGSGVAVSAGSGVAVSTGRGVSVGIAVAVSNGSGVFVGTGVDALGDVSSSLGDAGVAATLDWEGLDANASTSSIAVPAFSNVILMKRTRCSLNDAVTVSGPEIIPSKPTRRES